MKTTKGSRQLLKLLALGTIALFGAWVPAHALPAPVTRTFQNGVGGYTGTADTYIDAALASQATVSPIVADGSPVEQILIRFDSIFGPGANQIPAGSTITSATLTLWVGSTANDQSDNTFNLNRLLHPWSDTGVWANYGVAPWNATAGIQTDGVDALAAVSASFVNNVVGTSSNIVVTSSLQAWLSSPSSNYGWVILPASGTNGLRLESAESTTSSGTRKPALSVTFIPPCVSNAECNDGVSCTTDTCSAGVCQNVSNCLGGLTCNVTAAQCETVRSFQNVGAYTGTVDTYIDSGLGSQASASPIVVDSASSIGGGTNNGPPDQSLIRFDSIFGSGPGQIPAGSTVASATLTLWVGAVSNDQSSDAVNFHRLLHPWNATDVWAAYGVAPWNAVAGLQADGTDAVAAADASAVMNTLATAFPVNVTSSLQAWTSNPANNFGWAILPTGNNGLRLESADATNALRRPALSVTVTCLKTAATDSVCNGIDDDCDGSVDEDFVATVTTCGIGACASTGGSSCSSGVVVTNVCTPGLPSVEACNGIDDDCDGIVDIPACTGSFSLVAKPFVKTIAGSPVPMWGFALDTGGDCVTGPEVPTVPGPRLGLPVGVSNLSITVRNCVSESISLAIPGLTRALDPTFVDTAPVPSVTATGSRPGGDVTSRIRSFDTEIMPGSTHTYNWTGVKPGTYLYQSGTHSAVQVQMGLYGMLTHDYAAGQAYQGVAYDREALLVYSEVDPTRPIVPSALGFAPQYFLVNGESFSPASLPVAANAHERVLLRFVNAGLQNHVPTFLGAYMKAVAEDAHPYPYARDQYGVLLPAGKTLDAVWTVDACGGTTPLLDHRLWLSEPGTGAAGGMLVKFVAAPSGVIPVALNDPSYAVVQGNTLVVAAPGVLGNDTSTVPMTAVLVAGPANGTLTLDPSGSFRYTPNVGFSGADTFTYTANDCASSNIATVTVTVSASSNPAPIAAGNSYSVAEDGVLHTVAPGVLAGDTDPAPAGPAALTAVLSTGVSNGTLILNPNGSFDYTPLANYNGADSFTYRAYDGQFYSNVATVSLTVTPVNDAPVANDDTVQTKRQTPVVIPLLANDTDADGNAQINAATRTIVVQPSNAAGPLVLNPDGSVTYTARPGFVGTDTFTYTVRDAPANALSNQAVVRVNVTK